MLEVVGGVYLELCIEPRWNQFYGSGGRAAAALCKLNNDIALSTYISKEYLSLAENLAAAYGFELKSVIAPQTVKFSYFHPLSIPQIEPAIDRISPAPGCIVEAKNILRFGLLEGGVQVHGRYAVYDPQNARKPELFGENGSTAEHLAIVANYGECLKMTSQQGLIEPHVLGEILLEKERAEVVVIKQGSLGATVVTCNGFKHIPAFRTERVWSIGSGDVFAAVFAHFWASKRTNCFESARLASLGTAYYCETKRLPIPANFDTIFDPAPLERKNDFPKTSKMVYLAGPFFTMAERWLIEESRRYLLEQHFEVFSPIHDVGRGSANEVVPKDIEALNKCDLVFAVLDGLDAGTLFEIGYARSLNKPVIVFVQNESSENLKMLEGTNCEIVDDFVTAIYRTVWAAYQI